MKPGMRVYGTIVSHTLNNIVSYVNQIYDDDKKLFQSEINSGLQSSIDNIDSDISGIRSSVSDIQTDVRDLDEKITKEINDRLSGDTVLLDAIDLLNANSSTQGSVQYWIKQAIDAVIADAPEAFDTLKEIADWIAQDQHGTAALINRVAANEEAIAAINTAITQLETTLSQTDQRLSDAISTANSEIDQLQSDVTADVQDLQTFKTTVAQNELTLTTEINNAKQSIDSTQADLNQFKTDIRTEVESDISTAVSDSIAREQEIWTDVTRVDGRVTTVSNKVTDVDNTVKGITDANGNIKYTEALQSVIDTGISNNTAFNNISARWAVLDENQQVLEWMAAGFKSQVSPSTSFASVYATGKQETSDAISALNTTIAGLGNTYVAKANLSTEVNTIVKEGLNVDSYSEIALQSDVNSAESRMSSKYDTLSGTVGTLSSNVASISTKANSNEAKISAITTTDGSGTLFLNESKVDSAMYKLLANTSSSAYSGVSGIADAKIAALDVTSKINGAISSFREEVSEDYVAKANLSTEVESAIKTGLNIQSYSEIALDSDVSAAEARMASQYSTLDTNVRGLSTNLAAVSTKADANEAKVNAITTTDSSSTTVLSQSALNSAMILLLGGVGDNTKTRIESLAYDKAGDYFATIDILTIAHNAVEEEIALGGVASQAYVQGQVSSATTTIYSYLKDGLGNIISSASILNTADANAAKLAALATWNGNTPTGYVYTSGLVTDANKDSAVASLFALGASTTSKNNVMAMITAEVQGEVSSLTLTADKIYLNANETLANTIRATQGTIGGFTIGSDSIYYGDNVSGEFAIVASETSGPVLSITGSAGLEESHGVRLNESGLTFYSNYRRLQRYAETNKINLDGSGRLSNGSLEWDSYGNLTIGSNDSGYSGSVTLVGGTIFTALGTIRVIGDITIENSASQQPGYIHYMDADDAIAVKNLHIGGVEQGASGTITFGDTAGSVYISEPEDDYLELHASNGIRILGQLAVGSVSGGYMNIYAEHIYGAGFHRNGSSDSYVLLGGGGHSQLKTINGNSIFGTGDITISGGSSTIDWSNVQNKPNFATVATSGSYNDLNNKPTIPTVPTNVSAFTNDAGYLTQHQSLAGYLPLNGGTMTGNLNFSNGNYGNLIEYWNGENWMNSIQFDGYGSLSLRAAQTIMLQPNSNDNGLTYSFGGTGLDIYYNDHYYTKINEGKIGVYYSNGDTGSGTEIDCAGVTADKFVKTGGTSSQFLKADGSVDSKSYLPTELENVNGNVFRFFSTGNSYGNQGSAILKINENRVPSLELEDDADPDGDYNSVVVSAIGISFHEGDQYKADLGTDGRFGFKELYDYEDSSLGRVYTSTIVDFFVNQVSSSDETLKDKIADVELSAEQIASAPSIKYTWKDKEKGSKVYIGTTAQYWQDIIPEAVSEDKDGKLGLNYQGLSMTAVISLAKEVVELKAKVAELESKLNS